MCGGGKVKKHLPGAKWSSSPTFLTRCGQVEMVYCSLERQEPPLHQQEQWERSPRQAHKLASDTRGLGTNHYNGEAALSGNAGRLGGSYSRGGVGGLVFAGWKTTGPRYRGGEGEGSICFPRTRWAPRPARRALGQDRNNCKQDVLGGGGETSRLGQSLFSWAGEALPSAEGE